MLDRSTLVKHQEVINMKRTILPIVVGLVSLISTVPARADVFDALKITDGTGKVVVDFSKTDDAAASQFFSATQVGAIPNINNFKPGTLFLTEPAGAEPAGEQNSILTTLGDPPVDVRANKYSDALSINGSLLTGKFNVFFISDGASAEQAKSFPVFDNQTKIVEKTGPQDVSAAFGFPAGSIMVTSDVPPIPEPSTWLLFAFGLVVLVALGRRINGMGGGQTTVSLS
jgi:hypothetical protein